MIYQENTSTVYTNVNSVANSSEGNSETKIKITTNGDTTNIESHDSGNLSVKSVNGKTTINASPGMNVIVTGSDVKVTGSIDSTFSGQASKSAHGVKAKIKKLKQEIKLDLWQRLRSIFEKIF